MDGASGLPSARRALILLVALSGALLALSIVQRDRALQQVYDDAQDRAALYAGTVLRSSLTEEDLAGPLAPERRNAVFAEVQGFVLPDETVARVRVWNVEGGLVFSTDPADEPGSSSRDPAIEAASRGRTGSRLAVEALSRSTVAAEPTPTALFQTFVPLRVAGTPDVVGVVEVERFAAELESRADDPWWIVQLVAFGLTVLLAVAALVSVARGMRGSRPARTGRRSEPETSRRSRRASGWEEDVDALRERLDRATTRAREAEEAASSFAARLQQVTARLEKLESQSPDERIAELQGALKRSEVERALLRAGRPETAIEAEVRDLRSELREARSRAKAAEALVAGGDLSEIQQQLSAAARDVDVAVERAKLAEARADAAEERAASTDEMASRAEQRIDALESTLREIAASGPHGGEGSRTADLQRLVAEATARADEMERRAVEAEARSRAPVDPAAEELLKELEERLVAAEARGSDTAARLRAFEEKEQEGGSALRQRLGVTAAGRKLAAPAVPPPEAEVDPDLLTSFARGLRAPLTRATGLALSLQSLVGPGDARNLLRQLTASLRRLDRLAADLHELHRIADGSLRLDRGRVDLAALVATTVDETDRLEDRLVRVDADTVFVRVDAARARQIVEGMLDAARERTRTGASIVVRVRDTDAGGRLSVEDDNRTPAVLGPELNLAARLAELHGTEVVADGSTFRVMFEKDDRS